MGVRIAGQLGTLLALMAAAALSAAPGIDSVSPQMQKPGDSVEIVGTGFGTAPGYVTFAGLSATPANWSNNRIAVAVPEGASSGNICVVDAAGRRSTDGPAFTVDYADRVEPEWRVSHPDDFTLKDYGHFGAANRVEARGRFLFVHYSTGVATYDMSQTPYIQKSNFYLPSKMADWKLHGGYLYMVGDFGLRIYEAGELERGDSREPVLRGAFTGKQTDAFPPTTANVTFRYVAIQDCSALPIALDGEPFTGTLVAAAEFYDPHGSPRVFFFEWDGAATLRLLTVYGGAHFLNINVPLQQPGTGPALPLFRNRNYLFCLAFDPLNPKLYVAAGLRTTHDAGAKFNYLYEFDISDLDSLSVNNADPLLRIEDHNHTPNDMVVYQDKLWIALYAAFSYPSARAFNGYDLHAGSTPVSERTYIDACHPEAPTNTTHNHLCHLALIPEQGLVVGTTGMSTDTQALHNIFLFKADTPTNEHVPLASSESIDWSQDIAATTGKIFVADEWVNVVTLPYTFDGTNAVIQHHPEPPWEDPTRIFGGGWFSANMWEHENTLYVGSGATRLFAIDARDLGDFTRWRSWNDKWSVDNGTHLGADNYIFAIGFEENFVVAQDGARLLLIHEDPETGEFAIVNASNIPHFPMKMSNLYMNSASSSGGGYSSGVRLGADNVVVFTIPDHGLFAYYVDPATTTMQQRAQVALVTTGTVAFGYTAQTFTDVDFVDPVTLAVSESWTQGSLFPPAPEPDWGGIHFYRIDYSDGGPPTPSDPGRRIGFAFTGELKCLKGYQVDALATGCDGWVTARIHWKDGLVRKRRTILFEYADMARLNALSNEVALAEIMMPLTNFAPAIAEMGVRSACFRQDGRLVIPVGCEQWDGIGKTGVYVFDRSTKEQVHYYPGGRCGSAFYDPQHFAYYPDSNVQLVPAPTAAYPTGGGDVFIGTQWAGQVARLGRKQNSPTPPTLENAFVRLDFNGANYALTNIVDKTTGAEFGLGANAPLWQMLLLDRSALSSQVVWAQHFADVWATDTNAAPTRNHYLEDTASEQILHLDWTDVPLPHGGTATVNAEVRLLDDSAESAWTIAVDTTGPTDALWRVTFPLVLLKPIGGDNTDDIAAVPIRSGLLVPDPHINKVAGFSPYDAPLRYGPSEIAPDANDIFKSALGGVHPGRWEMQWMHVYDDASRNGLFLRSTDTNGYVKALTLCPVHQASPIGTLVHWQHYPENNTAATRNYTPPYDVRLRPMSGDWFDAARLYRSWLTSQVWCAEGPLIDNPDFPHPVTNGPSIGVGMTVKCGGNLTAQDFTPFDFDGKGGGPGLDFSRRGSAIVFGIHETWGWEPVTGTIKGYVDNFEVELHVERGPSLEQITDRSGGGGPCQACCGIDHRQPVLDPSGSNFVFASTWNNDEITGNLNPDRNQELFLYNIASNRMEQLTITGDGFNLPYASEHARILYLTTASALDNAPTLPGNPDRNAEFYTVDTTCGPTSNCIRVFAGQTQTTGPNSVQDRPISYKNTFDSMIPDPEMSWITPVSGPTGSLQDSPGHFRFDVPNSRSFDCWLTTDNMPRLSYSGIEGDWWVETRLTRVSFSGPEIEAGLCVRLGTNDYLTHGVSQSGFLLSNRTGTGDVSPSTGISTNTVELRIAKKGTQYTFSYRLPGETLWMESHSYSGIVVEPESVGLFVKTWAAVDAVMDFDFLTVSSCPSDWFTEPDWQTLANLHADLSSAGRYMVWASNRNIPSMNNPAGANPDENYEIYLKDLSSGNIIQITQSSDGDTDASAMGANLWPQVDNTSSRIVFASNRNYDGAPITTNLYSIFLRDFTGNTSRLTQVEINVEREFPAFGMDNAGSRVVFASEADLTGRNADRNPEIFVVMIPSGVVTQVTDTAVGVINSRPLLSGDGKKIAFLSNGDLSGFGQNADGSQELWVYHFDQDRLYVDPFIQVTSLSITPSALRGRTHWMDWYSLDYDGSHLVMCTDADLTGQNAGNYYEIFLAIFDWDPEPDVWITEINQGNNGSTEIKWQGNRTNLSYMVETCSDPATRMWIPATPTNQWWISNTVWTNSMSSTPHFFRVKAREE